MSQPVIERSVGERAGELVELARFVHQHPELGYEERLACERRVKLLQRWGFDVRAPISRWGECC